MKNCVSSDRNLAPYAETLKGHGLDFVFRYYSATTQKPEKRLTALEALALSAVGLAIAVVYEDGPTFPAYFSTERGHLDGRNTHQYAQELDQPVGSTIYFAIDYDASLSQLSGAIEDYFRGVSYGMNESGGGSSLYAVGVYGSGTACS